jgi:hypothetical protein
MVAKFNAVVSVIANGLRSLPTTLNAPKERPSQIGKLFSVAIAAGQKERQSLTWQSTYVPLLRSRAHFIRPAIVLNDKFATDFKQPGRGNEPGAYVAKWIEIVTRRDAGRKMHRLVAENVPVPRWVGGEHQHHRNCVGTLKSDVVACPDMHKNLHKNVLALGKPKEVIWFPRILNEFCAAGLKRSAKRKPLKVALSRNHIAHN